MNPIAAILETVRIVMPAPEVVDEVAQPYAPSIVAQLEGYRAELLRRIAAEELSPMQMVTAVTARRMGFTLEELRQRCDSGEIEGAKLGKWGGIHMPRELVRRLTLERKQVAA